MPEHRPRSIPGAPIKALETAHLVALAVWLGAVVMSGVVAAVVFPTMRELDPTLGRYPGFTGDHAILGAGHIAARVFAIADLAQFAGAVIALGSAAVLMISGRISNRRWIDAFRVLTLAVALTSLSYHLFILGPRMDANLRSYWAAAGAADNPRAERARLAFGEDHPVATRVLTITATSTFVALCLGAWCVQSSTSRGRDEESD